MLTPWPALFTVLAIGLLLLLIIRYQMQPFIALLIAGLVLGLASGLPPVETLRVMGVGIGKLLEGVLIILALGAILGRMLEASGAAEVIAQTLVNRFGEKRAPFALLLAAFLVGIPVLFNVGFLVLIPIVYRLQMKTGRSLIVFLVPMAMGLSVTHSLVPPHPGIIGAVQKIGEADPSRVMVETILFGSMLAMVLAVVAWSVSLFWTTHIETPKQFANLEQREPHTLPAFAVAVLIVVLPLVLSLLGFGLRLLRDLGHVPDWMSKPWSDQPAPPWFAIAENTLFAWLEFAGNPAMALFIATGLAFWLLGGRQGMDAKKLAQVADKGLNDVGSMAYLFGAAGGFSEVIKATGADRVIAQFVQGLPISPLASAYLAAVLVRMALGSATAAILTVSSLVAGIALTMPGYETLLVLAVAVGVTIGTQPADTGFWMLKEYGNFSIRQVLFNFNSIRVVMSLTGISILLFVDWWLRGP